MKIIELSQLRFKFPRFFLNRKELAQLSQRIIQFEHQTHCEIVFHFRRNLGPHPRETNRGLFKKFNLDKTKSRCGILITISLNDRQIAVWADEGIHHQLEEGLWQNLIHIISSQMKEGKRIEALLAGLDHLEPILQETQSSRLPPTQNQIKNAPLFEDES